MSRTSDPETDDQFPFRSGPRYLAGFLTFVVVITFVGLATRDVPTALVAAFAFWLIAVLVTWLIDRRTRGSRALALNDSR